MAEEDWREAMAQAASAFRLGQEGEGNEMLGTFIDGLEGWLASVAPQRIHAIYAVLEPMLQAQGRGDYLFLADLLEYELAPILSCSA